MAARRFCAGTLVVSPDAALGRGQLVVQAGQGGATLDVDNKYFQYPIDFEGGVLHFSSTFDLTGAVTVDQASVIDAAAGKTVTFTSSEGIRGTATLTVQGPGKVSLNCSLHTDVTVGGLAVGMEPGEVQLGSGFTGSGASLIVNGGTLSSFTKNSFEGDTQLVAGTIDLKGTDALGEGTLTVMPAGSPVAIDPMGGNVTLNNSLVNLQGGKLDVLAGKLLFNGQVTVNPSSEIDPANGAVVTLASDLADGGSGSTLTVGTLTEQGATGEVVLAGTLTTALDITGIVHLTSTFSGSGSITVSAGGLLTSLGGIGEYVGKVDLQNGTALVYGTNPLGTGELDLGSAGNSVTLAIENSSSNTYLNNATTLNGGTIQVTEPILGAELFFFSQVTTSQDTILTSSSSTLRQPAIHLTNVVGTAGVTLDGSYVVIDGDLESRMTVANNGSLYLNDKAGGTGTVIVNGGLLRGHTSNAFAGSIQLLAGTIQIDASNALGTANLSLAGTGSTTSRIKGAGQGITLAVAVTLNGGTVYLQGSNIIFSGPVSIAQPTTVQVLAGTTDTLTGKVSSAFDPFLQELHKAGQGELDLSGTLSAVTLGVDAGILGEIKSSFAIADDATVNTTNGGKIEQK